MAIHNLTKKTRASTGQKITLLGPADNTMRVTKLEKRLDNQEEKLDKISIVVFLEWSDFDIFLSIIFFLFIQEFLLLFSMIFDYLVSQCFFKIWLFLQLNLYIYI